MPTEELLDKPTDELDNPRELLKPNELLESPADELLEIPILLDDRPCDELELRP